MHTLPRDIGRHGPARYYPHFQAWTNSIVPTHPDYGHSRILAPPHHPGVVLSVMLQHFPTAPPNDVGITLTMHLNDLLSIAATTAKC